MYIELKRKKEKTAVMYFGGRTASFDAQNYEAELPEYYPPPRARRWTKQLRVIQSSSSELVKGGKAMKAVQTTANVKTR